VGCRMVEQLPHGYKCHKNPQEVKKLAAALLVTAW
jgi:hypothetical protein